MRYEIVESKWDSNGAHHVIVRDTQSAFRTSTTESGARKAAKRADPMRKTQWTRLDRVFLTDDVRQGMHYVFTVSRLDRRHR